MKAHSASGPIVLALIAGLVFAAPAEIAALERVDEITLESGEDQVISAVIDPAGEFAYFGTNTNPGRVVRIEVALAPALALDKTATAINGDSAATTYRAVGDVIGYTITANNNGGVTLTNLAVSDPQLGTLDCDPTVPATLAPGESVVCTGDYTVTQADMDAGSFTNTATADSDQTDGVTDDQTVNAGCPDDLDLSGQTVSDTRTFVACVSITAGDFTVTSTGDVTFRAGERIILKEGFQVEPGGKFSTDVDPTIE